jgi:TM2 domain-containing membrane protein YozV
LLFLLIPIAGISFYPDKAILFIAINATILLLPEKNNNKLILFIAIVVAIIINNVNFNVKLNKNINDYYSIINNPVSLEYLNYKIEQDPENYDLKVVRNIKYPKSSINLKGVPKNKFSDVGIVNLSIYYLMNKKFDKFKHLLKNNTLLKNPIILLNLSSYFTITFQYKELEDINLRLYNYEFYYKLAETYQHNTKNSLFIPYSGSKANIFLEKLNYNVQNIIIFLLILISVFVFIVYLSKLRELFKCDSCGNVFCAQCDDGYDSDQICATCRNIIFRKGNAEASILVKKTILMENYKQHLKIFSRILSAIIPGAGQIFINNPIKGIIMTTFFSIVLFILIFRFEPFIGPENYALNLIFTPLYIIIFGVFALIYILNIFRRK